MSRTRTHEDWGRVWIFDNTDIRRCDKLTDETVHVVIDHEYEDGWAEFVPDYTPCVHGILAIDCEHGNPRVTRCEAQPQITHEEA